MRWQVLLTPVILLALAMPATAGSVPAVYFLKDTDSGPAVDGWLDWQPPDPADLENPANNTPPSSRMITAFKAEQFVRMDGANNTGRILGPVIMGLWAPETPLIDEATLVIEMGLYEDGLTPLIMEGEPLASARVPIQGGNITPPDPESFVPPNPTDPESSAAYVAAQAAAYALPYVLQAPYVIVLATEEGTGLDVEVDPEARVGISMMLEAPDGGLTPVPIGAGQPIEYDFGLAPTFVYIPWYEPEPPPTTSTSSSSSSTTTTTTGGSPTIGTGTQDGDDGKDSPIPLFLVPVAIGLALLRKRLR